MQSVAWRIAGMVAIVFWLASGMAPAFGQAAKTKTKGKRGLPTFPIVEPEYVVPLASSGPLASGLKVSLELQTGKGVADAEVVEVLLGKEENSLKSLAVTSGDGKRKQTVTAAQLSKITTADHEWEVRPDVERKTHVLIDVKKRDAAIGAELRAKGHRLWADLDDEQQAKSLEEMKAYVKRVGEVYKPPVFTLHETKYFLFYTDMPVNQVAGYILNLDRMYTELCKMFRVPAERNIWKGKCLVIAFVEQASFQEFERTFMNKPETGSAQGLCHSFGDGRVIISCYRGNNPAFFGTLLVHETSHGFLHRCRSSVFVPTWINEGIADWVAGIAVPQSKEVSRRQAEAVERMRQLGNCGPNFFDGQGGLDRWQYGVASSLTNFLLAQDPARYGGMLLTIKDGRTWRECLQEIYGVTPEELVAAYGASVGLPGLRP